MGEAKPLIPEDYTITLAEALDNRSRVGRRVNDSAMPRKAMATSQTQPPPAQLSSIYDEIKQLWISTYTTIHRSPDERDEFTEFLSEQEREARSKTTVGLQPWLGILEFGIEWLSYVHVALTESAEADKGRPEHVAAWVLTGSAVSFGLSIRLLCISGFDTPARALLRSYVETLFLCLAILDDKTLARAFVDAHADAEIKTFWHKEASPKNLHTRIMQIEKKTGLTDDQIDPLKAWRLEEYEILSQSPHLSFLAALLAARSNPLGDRQVFKVGIFGLASENSHRTISYAAATTWYFSRLCWDYLVGKQSDGRLLVVDESDEWHRKIVLGRDVLSQVTLAHWDELGLGSPNDDVDDNST
jgi:hypothetical protein